LSRISSKRATPLFELKTTNIFNNRTSYIVIIPYKNTFFDTFINEKGEIASVFPRMPQIKGSSLAIGREKRDANGQLTWRLGDALHSMHIRLQIDLVVRKGLCGNASS
jgi:hypothetical protein